VPVRLDATAVQLKTEDFIARAMAALMPLIITIGAMFLIKPKVLAPFARL
jgi:hypothetical protein